MSRHQPQPVMRFTGSRFGLDGRDAVNTRTEANLQVEP